MAIAEIIAIGDSAVTSDDVVIATLESVGFCLKGVDGPHARVVVEAKDDDGLYWPIGEELTSNHPSANINLPATLRLRRIAGGTCGVFRAG